MLLFLFFVSVEFKFEEKEIIIENGNFFARFNVVQIKEDGDTDCFVLACVFAHVVELRSRTTS